MLKSYSSWWLAKNEFRDGDVKPVRADDLTMNIVTAPDCTAAVELARNTLGLAHLTFHLASSRNTNIDAPFVRSTYPQEWIGHYIVNNYADIDQVVRVGFTAADPFLWSGLPQTPEFIALLEASRTFGVGNAGCSIPVVDKAMRRSLLSMTTDEPATDLARYLEAERDRLIAVAGAIHAKAIDELNSGTTTRLPALSPREIECLSWAAEGKTYGEIALILGLADSTVRMYLKDARHRLDSVTIAQAIAKAKTMRII
jgi:DNA-binding CsgD family transcriptional regulator